MLSENDAVAVPPITHDRLPQLHLLERGTLEQVMALLPAVTPVAEADQVEPRTATLIEKTSQSVPP